MKKYLYIIAILGLAFAACSNEPNNRKTQIAQPELEETQFTFNEEPHTVKLTVEDDNLYTLEGDVTETNIGTYTATVTLNDTANYEWADGTTEPLSLNWSIVKIQIAKPALTANQFTFNESQHTVTISPINDDLYTLGGQTTGTAIGNYTATVTLIVDTDIYVWADGTTVPSH